MATDETVQQFLRSFDLVPPLDPRDAFFWGRTGAVEREKRYAMWMSRLCIPGRTRTVPTPSVIRRSSPSLTINPSTLILVWRWWTFFLPPVCFIPCYPSVVVRNSSFHSASAVSGKNRSNPCWIASITAIIRMLIGCCAGPFSTPELFQAVAQGYTIHRIHEVWHFPPLQRRTGLFAEYVNT